MNKNLILQLLIGLSLPGLPLLGSATIPSFSPTLETSDLTLYNGVPQGVLSTSLSSISSLLSTSSPQSTGTITNKYWDWPIYIQPVGSSKVFSIPKSGKITIPAPGAYVLWYQISNPATNQCYGNGVLLIYNGNGQNINNYVFNCFVTNYLGIPYFNPKKDPNGSYIYDLVGNPISNTDQPNNLGNYLQKFTGDPIVYKDPNNGKFNIYMNVNNTGK